MVSVVLQLIAESAPTISQSATLKQVVASEINVPLSNMRGWFLTYSGGLHPIRRYTRRLLFKSFAAERCQDIAMGL